MLKVYLANIDNAFGSETRGKEAAKCQQIASRYALCGNPQDDSGDHLMIVYERPSEAFYTHLRDTVFAGKNMPRIVAPTTEYDPNDPDDYLSLVRLVKDDEELMSELKEIGKQGGVLIPFVDHPDVRPLAKAAGLQVAGLSQDDLDKGKLKDLQSKTYFQEEVLKALQIPYPDGESVETGIEDVAKGLASRLDQDGKAHLRQDRSAGGIGNKVVNDKEVRNYRGVLEFLFSVLFPLAKWMRGRVIVEELLDLWCSPGILMRLDHGKSNLLGGDIQRLGKGGVFHGVMTPPPVLSPEMLMILEILSIAVSRRVVELLGPVSGFFNVDFGILRQAVSDKTINWQALLEQCEEQLKAEKPNFSFLSGIVVAFEMNWRVSGLLHGLRAKERLRPDDGVAWTNDAFSLPEGVNLKTFLKMLEAGGFLYDPEEKRGVFVHIDEHDGYIGYTIIANDHLDAARIDDAIRRLKRRPASRSSVVEITKLGALLAKAA